MIEPPRLPATSPFSARGPAPAGPGERPAREATPLRAGGDAGFTAHLGVLLFSTIFLGIFAVAWPFTEASVDRCERARCPGPRIAAVAAAPAAPTPLLPPPADPTGGLGDGWMTGGSRHQAVDPLSRGSSRLLRQAASARRLWRGSPFAPSAASPSAPRALAPAGRVEGDRARGLGVPSVRTLAQRGPPSLGLRRADPLHPLESARVRRAGISTRQPVFASSVPPPAPSYRTISIDAMVPTSRVVDLDAPPSRSSCPDVRQAAPGVPAGGRESVP